MDLMVFMPKTPVSLSAQIHKDVTNGEYSGAILDNKHGSGRRYFTAGFSLEDLEGMGLTDSTQLSQLRSMDDAGSIDLVTFESDPEHIGFILTKDLHNVIHGAIDDLQKLKRAKWSIFEIIDPLSETPHEGTLKPLAYSNGQEYRVPFGSLPDYFKHVVETGELMPESFMREEDNMVGKTPANREFTDEELHALMEGRSPEDSKSMSLAIEEKKSFDDEIFESGEEYYQEQLRREAAEKRRKEEEAQRKAQEERARAEQERKRREQQVQEKATAQNGGVFIPKLKAFNEIVSDLGIQPDSDIQRFYLSNLTALAEYADSMNIDAAIFNSFDAQGRRDLMISMNREREKLVNQALVQLKREAMDAEDQVSIDSEDASVSVREKHNELYMKPLEERQQKMRDQLDHYLEERETLLESGYKEWLERVENDPEAVYNEIYRKPLVEDAIEQEKERLNQSYMDYRNARQKEMDDYIAEFIQARRERDLDHLRLNWSEAARLGAQTLNDRVDSARSQMDSRRMMTEMRRMYEQIEIQSTKQLEHMQQSMGQSEPTIERQSQTARSSGTVQQQRPEPRVQAPSAPIQPVEQPKQEPVTRVVPTPPQVAHYEPTPDDFVDEPSYDEEQQWEDEPVDDTFEGEYEDDNYEEEYEDTDDQEAHIESAPQPTAPQPVISRPSDMQRQNHQPVEEDPWDEFVEDDFEDDDYIEDDDLNDEFEDDDAWDDEDLDDSEVAKKPRKKGLRGLFGKR